MSNIKHKQDLLKLGRKIKELRREKGHTQAQVAADCNVEISQISRIERGLLNTGVIQIFNIAKSLNINPKEIFDFQE